MRNPYITGRWVRGTDFYGRRTLIDTILYGPDNSLWVMGLRRSGKTSLLRQVELLSEKGDYLPLFWDLQGCESPEDFALSLYEGVEEAEERFQRYGKDEEIARWEDLNLFELLKELSHFCKGHNLKLLLLIDEAEALNRLARKNPRVLERLRRTFQRSPLIRTVLVSGKRLSALGELCRGWETSPFLHGFTLYYLDNFSPDETADLVHQRQRVTPVQAPSEVVMTIYQLTRGHPYLVQLLCAQLFTDGCLRPLTEADLSAVDAQMVDLLSNDFDALSHEERRIIRAVLEEGTLPSDMPSALLYGLIRLGILRRSDGGYAIGNEFFARWLREHADWEAKSEVSADGTLAMYTQSQLEPVLRAVRENRLALGEMERALDAIRRLLRAWQREGVPLSPGAKHTLEKMAKALEKPARDAMEMRHQLELTLPLIPGILVYKAEMGGDVRDQLESLLKVLSELFNFT